MPDSQIKVGRRSASSPWRTLIEQPALLARVWNLSIPRGLVRYFDGSVPRLVRESACRYQGVGHQDQRQRHYGKASEHSHQDTHAGEKVSAIGDRQAAVVVEDVLVAAWGLAESPTMGWHTGKRHKDDKPDGSKRPPARGRPFQPAREAPWPLPQPDQGSG